jgi:ABC-2 type transport system ATP-binding protein
VPILQVNQLSKSYGRIVALKDFSLTLEPGNIFGLLGPNGSGKTTFLGLITSILKPDSGEIVWFDNSLANPNLRIGSLLETPNFYPFLNANQNLDIVRRIKGLPDKDFSDTLELVKLASRRRSKFSTYSLGMKQRLAIAAVLIGEPEVMIFDEPTNGLDPEGIAEVRSIIKRISQSGKTVIMASHILDEVEKICSHVAIIKSGSLLASGPVGMILGDQDLIELSAEPFEGLIKWLNSNEYTNYRRVANDQKLELEINQDIKTIDFVQAIQKEGLIITHLVRRKRKLEEEFLQITKNSN